MNVKHFKSMFRVFIYLIFHTAMLISCVLLRVHHFYHMGRVSLWRKDLVSSIVVVPKINFYLIKNNFRGHS